MIVDPLRYSILSKKDSHEDHKIKHAVFRALKGSVEGYAIGKFDDLFSAKSSYKDISLPRQHSSQTFNYYNRAVRSGAYTVYSNDFLYASDNTKQYLLRPYYNTSPRI